MLTGLGALGLAGRRAAA
ncbi:hypothetical protein [Roseovarius tolerans]